MGLDSLRDDLQPILALGMEDGSDRTLPTVIEWVTFIDELEIQLGWETLKQAFGRKLLIYGPRSSIAIGRVLGVRTTPDEEVQSVTAMAAPTNGWAPASEQPTTLPSSVSPAAAAQ